MPSDRPGRLFIECKTTANDKLDDTFLSDVSQHIDEDFDAYLLVTNAVITPYTHYRAAQVWRKLDKHFLLLDRARLYRAFAEANLTEEAKRLGLIPPALSEMHANFDGLSVATQSGGSQFGSIVETYMAIRNHSRYSQSLGVSLAADIDWRIDEDGPLQVVLAPGEDQVCLLRSQRNQFDVTSPLRLSLSGAGRAHVLTVIGERPQLVLQPPFVGAGHRCLLAKIRSAIEHGHGFQLISVHGEAGVGKSRTIEEALSALEGARFIFRLVCDPRSGHFDVPSLIERISQVTMRFGENCERRPDSLDEAIELLQDTGVHTVLLLEDLHHARPREIASLKSLIMAPPSIGASLTLVVTGRDDFTFPNADYFSLLDLMRSEARPHVSTHSLERLKSEDAETLIRAVAANLPDAAVSQVFKLGQCNPFVLIEILQFLLDVGLARLLSRRTIGVLDPARFIGLGDLPKKVEELYERRLAALSDARDGHEAERLLLALSCLPPDAGHELIDDAKQVDDAVFNLLIQRRFLVIDSFSNKLCFAHENLYNFLRRWIRAPERAFSIASNLLEYDELIALLDALPRAELLSLAGHHDKAFELLFPAWNSIQSMSNFSSEEIDRSYYPFLHALFMSARATGHKQRELAKVAAALAYMGVHNFPLVQGEHACAQAEAMLGEIFTDEPEGEVFHTAINQLRSHALQNLGRSGAALRRMQELEARFKERGISSPEVAFDLYDRLQEHYRKSNHAELMEHYGRLAANAVAGACDEKLRASHLITMSLMWIYRRDSNTIGVAEQALRCSEAIGIRRFVVFNQLTGLIAETLACREAEQLRDIYERAKELLRLAACNTYSDSIIRLLLLLATLAPHVSSSQEEGRRLSREYIAAGQESSIRFGIGLYDWAFDNLAGALDCTDPATRDEDARRRFDTCLVRLRRRGLGFMGACSGTYPNSMALANIIRFRAQFRESDGANLIEREISAYDETITTDEESVQKILKAAIAGKAIFWPKVNRPMLRLPERSGYFTPII